MRIINLNDELPTYNPKEFNAEQIEDLIERGKIPPQFFTRINGKWTITFIK